MTHSNTKKIETNFYRRHKPEYSMVAVVSLLLIIGLITVYTTAPGLEAKSVVGRQFAHIVLGFVAFFVASNIHFGVWRKLTHILLGISIVASLLLLVPSLSIEVNGATRWLNLGAISFQPAEIIKFALVVYLAVFLSERMLKNKLNSKADTLYPIFIITAIIALLVAVLQKDLGTMGSIVGIILVMLFVSGLKLKWLGAYIGSLLAIGLAAVLLFPHRLARFMTFIDPSSDIEGSAYHINQALIAVGSGGWFGRGLGNSVQAFGYLPEAVNDSIFAVVAEEFGFIGSIVILILYGVLLFKLVKIIKTAPNEYAKMFVAGVFGWLLSHIVINIGAMIGLLPLTGITLPFLSFGGTSLLFIMAALGVVFNISRYTSFAHSEVKERRQYGFSSSKGSASRGRNSRPHYTAQSYRI